MVNRLQKGLNKEALEIAWYRSQGCVTERQNWNRWGQKDAWVLPLSEEEKKTLTPEEIKKRKKSGLFDFVAKWPVNINKTSYVQVKSHIPPEAVFNLIRRFKAGWAASTDEFIISIVREQHWEYHGSHCVCGQHKRRRKGICKKCNTEFIEDKTFVERSTERIAV